MCVLTVVLIALGRLRTSSYDDDFAGKVGDVGVGFKRLAATETEHVE
jgi:hypothetical protein